MSYLGVGISHLLSILLFGYLRGSFLIHVFGGILLGLRLLRVTLCEGCFIGVLHRLCRCLVSILIRLLLRRFFDALLLGIAFLAVGLLARSLLFSGLLIVGFLRSSLSGLRRRLLGGLLFRISLFLSCLGGGLGVG